MIDSIHISISEGNVIIAKCQDDYENAWFGIEYMIAIQHRYIYTTLKATKTYLRIYVYTFTYLNIHIVRSTTL